MAKTTKATKQLDRFIETTFYRHFTGVEIRLLDITKIYAAGRKAGAEGGDIEAAVLAAGRLAHQAVSPGCTCAHCEPTGPTVRQTTCRYCALDIEGWQPYVSGEWRDRGNCTHCPDHHGGQAHAPMPEVM